MTESSDDIRDPLEGLPVEKFRKAVCPEGDALVVFVPEGNNPPPEVQRVLDETGLQRWFPIEGGNIVKCPYVGDTYEESLFKDNGFTAHALLGVCRMWSTSKSQPRLTKSSRLCLSHNTSSRRQRMKDLTTSSIAIPTARRRLHFPPAQPLRHPRDSNAPHPARRS